MLLIETTTPHNMETIKPLKPSKREGVHYVNNREFSQNVVDYVNLVKKAKLDNTEIPRITEYIGRCFLRIAEGLSHKPNFIHYTYREEMVMDGVENCIKAIMNYNIEAATRTGSPNAFAYFTQINYYAFIRRIMKEKKQQEIKFRYIEYAGIKDFMSESQNGSDFTYGIETGFIDVLKDRIEKVKTSDKVIKEFKKKDKNDKKDKKDLELFMS